MATTNIPRTQRKPRAASADRLDRMSGEYERGQGAPFLPDSPEIADQRSPAVIETDRRSAESEPRGRVAGNPRSAVKAPKAPEHTRGKLAAARRAEPAGRAKGGAAPVARGGARTNARGR